MDKKTALLSIGNIKNFLLITISIFIMAVGVYFFKSPNNFTFGGVTGFAVVIAKVFPITAGNFTFIANLVLLLIGFVFLGKSFAIKTTYASTLLSLFLMLFEKIYPMGMPLTDQPILELFFAIALPAFGSAVLFNIGASSGGTDVIAMLLKKYTKVQEIGVALFISDLVMILVATFVFDIRTALFSFVGLLIKSFMIDGIIETMNLRKSVTIVCDDAEPICEYIISELHKSATVNHAYGAYSHRQKYIIFSTLTTGQAVSLRNYIREHEMNAFISVSSTSEVFGKGFSSI
ncbi:MAG: YitT family protein [Lachnospira sp.]|nr:YitT family protein [Lachnospira sp.]